MENITTVVLNDDKNRKQDEKVPADLIVNKAIDNKQKPQIQSDNNKPKKYGFKKLTRRNLTLMVGVPLGTLAIMTPPIIACFLQCSPIQPIEYTPWQDIFDTSSVEESRQQTANGINQEVAYNFDFQEPIPTDEMVYGQGRVTHVSEQGVNAQISGLELDPARKTATYNAKITSIPESNYRESKVYYADFEVEVQCKYIQGNQTIWITKIEELRISIEVGEEPTLDYDYMSISSNDEETSIGVRVTNTNQSSQGRLPNLQQWDGNDWINVQFVKQQNANEENADEIWNATLELNEANNFAIYLKGLNEEGFSKLNSKVTFDTSCLDNENAEIILGGNVMALINDGSKETTASEIIPSDYSFWYLFSAINSSSKITTISNPESFLPATTLSKGCYQHMFNNCAKLETLPALPADETKDNCYLQMFYNCKSIAGIPEDYLPATTLGNQCYNSMFSCCSNLADVPALPASTLSRYCYYEMFKQCSSIASVPEDLLSAAGDLTGGDYCYSGMFNGCASLENIPDLPATTLAEECYSTMFAYCTSLQSNDLPEKLISETLAESCYDGMFLGCTGITTLPEDFLPATTLANYCYTSLFSGCTGITTIPEGFLPATTLANYCYSNMFYNCTNLVNVPNDLLPVLTMKDACYIWMFANCKKLVSAPALPATTLAKECYSGMFSGCSILTQLPNLHAETLAEQCYESMFSNCLAITTLPEGFLPATNLAKQCYNYMFNACYGLESIPKNLLPANTMQEQCYRCMFLVCNKLKNTCELKTTNLATQCYENMFSGCINLQTIEKITLDDTSLQDPSAWKQMFYIEALSHEGDWGLEETSGDEGVVLDLSACTSAVSGKLAEANIFDRRPGATPEVGKKYKLVFISK